MLPGKNQPMESIESQLIETIRRLAGGGEPSGLRLGIGDDAAVYEPPRGEDLLLTTDQVVEETHFQRSRHPAHALGYKTVARAVSDVAAMGGTPRCALLSLSLPKWARGGWLGRYLRGLAAAAERFEAPLVGGDVARGEHFNAALTVVGSAPRAKALTRGGAKPGDALYVSGRLGGSALGLANLMEGASSTRSLAVRRHLYPEPRLELGRFLRRRVGASAAIDLSDGLSADAAKLAAASSVALEIEASRVPRYRAASIDQAIHGGEEYELMFTARPGRGVPPEFEGLLLTRIGTVHSGSGVSLRTSNGVRVLRPGGFRHFESDD